MSAAKKRVAGKRVRTFEPFLIIQPDGNCFRVQAPRESSRDDVCARESSTDPDTAVVGIDGEFPEFRAGGASEEFSGFGIEGNFYYWAHENPAVLAEMIRLNPEEAIDAYVDNWKKEHNYPGYEHVVTIDFVSHPEVRYALQAVVSDAYDAETLFGRITGVSTSQAAIFDPLYCNTYENAVDAMYRSLFRQGEPLFNANDLAAMADNVVRTDLNSMIRFLVHGLKDSTRFKQQMVLNALRKNPDEVTSLFFSTTRWLISDTHDTVRESILLDLGRTLIPKHASKQHAKSLYTMMFQGLWTAEFQRRGLMRVLPHLADLCEKAIDKRLTRHDMATFVSTLRSESHVLVYKLKETLRHLDRNHAPYNNAAFAHFFNTLDEYWLSLAPPPPHTTCRHSLQSSWRTLDVAPPAIFA